MRSCKKCGAPNPIRQVVGGKVRHMQRRLYCLTCSPFGSGNRKKLDRPLRVRKASEKYVRWQRKARRERKAELVAAMGGECSRCGYSKCLSALDFHHRNPNTKSFALSAQGFLRALDRLVEEAKKCVLLCRNCHAEVHEEERNGA